MAPIPNPTPRRSSQVRCVPADLRDFHCYTTLAALHKPYFSCEASIDPIWLAAMTKNFDASFKNCTGDMISLAYGKFVVDCK